MIDLSNSLSIYIQSEGRRPDLKSADEVKTAFNDSSAGGGDWKKGNTNFQDMSNVLLTADNKLNAIKEEKVFGPGGDISSTSSIDSDNTDLEDDATFFESTLKTRPVFNCKKRLTSHSK